MLCPQLCSRGLKERAPVWVTGKSLHCGVPINTAVAIPTFNFDEQEEYFVLLFALENVEVRASACRTLRIIAMAAI